MNGQNSKPRLVFRPMSLAIQSMALATASSVLLWTLGGGFDAPLPTIASAATKDPKADKAEKSPKADASKSEAVESEPTAVGKPAHAERPTVKLNYFSTPWEKVLEDLAVATESELIMDRVPKGRYSRRDKTRYNRHDAVRIINKEIEPLGFRLIEKGDFLIVIDLPSTRLQYPPAVLPSRQPIQAAPEAAPTAVAPERRVDSITKKAEPPAEVKEAPPVTTAAADSRKTPPARIHQASHDELPEHGTAPAPLMEERGATPTSQVIFRPRNRSVVDLSKQLYKSFKPRAELVPVGHGKLPAFTITTEAPAANKKVARQTAITISIDEDNEELFIDAIPSEADGIMKLLRLLDRPFNEEGTIRLAASSRQVCQIAHQLPEEIERIRAAKQAVHEDADGSQQPMWVAEGAPRMVAQVDEPPAGRQNPAALAERFGNLKGEVNIEAIEDLGVLILKGNAKDIDEVVRVINELERLSEMTAPQVHLLYLKNVDSESLALLLTSVYERLTKFPGTATRPRQSAAILPITKPNSLLIIAPENDLNAILDLAEELDKPVDPQTEFQVFGLKNAIAMQVSDLITQFYAERMNLGARILVVPDSRSNSIIVRAQPRDLEEISALVHKLDRDDPAAVNQLKIFPLKNAIAAELAAVMNAAIQSVIAPPTSNTGGGGNQLGGILQGLQTGQIDEQFRNVKSAVLKFLIVDSKGERDVRSGILADIRITPDSRVNTLIVSASEQSMSLIEELIKQLDRPTTTVSEIKVFTLANADAEMMVSQLNALFNNQQQGQGGLNQQRQNQGIALEGAADSSSSLVPLKFSVDKRTNSVIAIGARDALGVVEAILLRLDESDLRARQNVVIRLQNSQATLIAQSIQQFYQSQRDIAQNNDPNLMSSVEQLEKEVVVVPDTTNNSLLLSATPRYFKNIENMILKLDAAPRQVIIQAMLVEVELDNTDEFGIELGFQDPVLFNRSVKDPPVTNATTATSPNGVQTTTNTILSQSGSPGFNFNNPSLPLGNNLATAPATVATQGLTNFSLGRVNSNLGFGGLVLSAGSDAVNVLIRALSAYHKITVLSRPQIRALDNQQAEIFSGQQIPIITGFTANGTTGVNTPTVSQQMAGIQLQVMPRITADGNVVMILYAQRSQYRQQGVPLSTDVTGKTVSSPILDISRLNTTISVPNGNTVVIGGLIQTYDESTSNKAPFLADIPLLGNLFRYDSRTTKRVELLMFLTPRVISGGLEEETIKEVEMGRIHFIESEVEDMHGPLRAIPCPDDLFNGSQPPYPPNGLPPSPTNLSPLPGPPPAPGIVDPNLPPAPAPRPDPTTTQVIRDPELNPAAAQLKYTEEDSRPAVKQARWDAEEPAAVKRIARKPKLTASDRWSAQDK